MILYIVRHAWAGEFGDPRYPSDFDRPLTDEGRKRFRKWLKHLEPAAINPRVIWSSPYVRCKQTAEMLVEWLEKSTGRAAELSYCDALRCGADPAGVLAESQRSFGGGDEAWVGHMPDVSYLAAALIGDGNAAIPFSKGSIAAIQFDDRPQPRAGELLWLASPKMADI